MRSDIPTRPTVIAFTFYKFITNSYLNVCEQCLMFNICYVSPSSFPPILLLSAPLSASLYARKFETREMHTQ